MELNESQIGIIKSLLSIEHSAIANKLSLISESYDAIDTEQLNSAIGLLDELSRSGEERAKKIVVTLSAILWTYRKQEWEGLKEFLIVVLSRIGFSPSSIMLEEFYSETQKLSGFSSFLNEVSVTLHQLDSEIFIGEKKFLVTGFQKRVWNKMMFLKLLGISAPTSAGKSFIILLKSIDSLLKKDGNIIYIVPTLSLVAQVSADFNQLLKRFGLNNYRISTTYNSQEISGNKIYVLTQEKAISAFSQSEQPYKDVRVLVVDEIQNIERVANEGDQRAKTLYDTLMEFRHTCKPDLTIISGPRIDGLKELGIDIFDEQSTDEERTKESPVASFTYAISEERGVYFFNQYTDILKEPNRIKINNSSIIKGYGGAQYRSEFIEYLARFLGNLGLDSKNIIFSPTTAQARKTALDLAKFSDRDNQNSTLDSLVNYLRETVHDRYDMCSTIPKGFVYHHGKTPTHVRAVVERAIKDKLVPNVVCTTTLMQGVNLPAQNVILRNPHLAIRSRNGAKPKLTDYEIANLRGRAGRLLKDFIGRTFVLEENSFERDHNQVELFPEAEKRLKAGYGEKYEEFKTEIDLALESNESLSNQNEEYSFLMTYVRQTILRHREKSAERLVAVGIDLSDGQINSVFEAMNELTVPSEVCFKNRYWDPLDLEVLYNVKDRFNLPTSVSELNIEGKLESCLEFMALEFDAYYNKYFEVAPQLLRSACISAKDWMKEKPLKEILSGNYFNDPENIENRIALLQNKISYGLPMLLKPVYDIIAPDNMFLKFIEIGAFRPITRKMIELNIPRETAIYLNNRFFDNYSIDNESVEESIINRLRQVRNDMDYWRRVQVEGII